MVSVGVCGGSCYSLKHCSLKQLRKQLQKKKKKAGKKISLPPSIHNPPNLKQNKTLKITTANRATHSSRPAHLPPSSPSLQSRYLILENINYKMPFAHSPQERTAYKLHFHPHGSYQRGVWGLTHPLPYHHPQEEVQLQHKLGQKEEGKRKIREPSTLWLPLGPAYFCAL